MVNNNVKAERIFFAMGQPTRRRMVERLAGRERMSLSELAKPESITLPGALKQVRILEASGIVTCKKEGRVQWCSLNRKALGPAATWAKEQGFFWDASLARLEKIINVK